MNMRQVCVGIFASTLAACASVKTFNMPKVEGELSSAFQSSEEIAGKVQADLNEKKALQESLAKGKTAEYTQSEPQILAKLKAMETLAGQMSKARKKMTEARGQITALGYSKKKIAGDEPEYARVEEHVKDFETAAKEFNTAAGNYSRESNTLAEMVAQKKLFFNFDVGDFQTKVQKSLKSAKSNAKFMDQELERAEKIVNSFDGESRTVADALYQGMANAASDHNKKAEHLGTLNNQMTNLAGGQSKVSSTSPNWSEVQRVVSESERASFSLNELYKEFQNKTDKFRMSTKGSP